MNSRHMCVVRYSLLRVIPRQPFTYPRSVHSTLLALKNPQITGPHNLGYINALESVYEGYRSS